MNKMNKELIRVINIIIKSILPIKIILFGSRSKNKAKKNSDFDIFILVDNIKSTREAEKELYYQMAKENIGIPVDLIIDTIDKYERLKENKYLIYNQVERYGKTIYEKNTSISAMA